MISFYPIGRLGNICFQTAAAIGYARKFGYSWGVPRNVREVPRFHQMFPGMPISEDSGRRYNEHPPTICNQHGTHFDVCHFDYHDLENRGDSIHLFGFYQSWRYFEHCEKEVKERFKLDFIKGYDGFTSIHIRLGDYLIHNKAFPPVTVDYIEQAMMKIRTGKYLVFSDDIQWCKENLDHLHNSYQRFEFCEETDERKSLSLMASCSNHIIANSSFSWWGAYLGHNPDKIVVSPSHKWGNWFGVDSGVKKDCVDLLPPSWHQIEFRTL